MSESVTTHVVGEAAAANGAEAPANASQAVPLCVDLDGTLVKTDLLYESVLALIKSMPLYVFLIPFWLLRGKAYLKRAVCRRVELDVAALPYHAELVEYLRAEHGRGRKIVLATAADRGVAERVAAHVGVFDEVIASDGCTNLCGRHKLEAIEGRFGARGFDYAGNARVDLKIWRRCRGAIVVNPSPGVIGRAAGMADVLRTFESRPSAARSVVRAVRVHQWVKNLLVFVPLVTAHELDNRARVIQAVAAFVAFCMCASSAYLLNDLLDLRADRHHPSKKQRPFAAGDLHLLWGVLLTLILLGTGILIAAYLPAKFLIALSFYYTFTVAYSLYLKRKLLLDVYALGVLYTVRVLAGGAATGVPVSAWLVAFSMFLFLSLALVKRFAEIQRLAQEGAEGRAHGRNYRAADVQALSSLGTGSGFMCVLVLALYINSPQVLPLYRTPAALWLLCPLLMYWISRVWVLAFRGRMHSDPVLFALTDKVSYLVGLLAGVVMFVATLDWPMLK